MIWRLIGAFLLAGLIITVLKLAILLLERDDVDLSR